MRPRPNLLIATVVFALCLGRGAAGWAGEDATYPIWWAPSLELESLDQIDERLERKFWADPSTGIPVVKGKWPGDTKAFVDSCASYDKLRNEGYYARSNLDLRPLLFQATKCQAIRMLKEARPSRISHVNDVTLNPGIVDYLPAMVDPGVSCDMLCRQYDANERCVPWSKFGVSRLDASIFESIDVVDPHQMEVKTRSKSLTLHILARADFNDDGLEDLLLRVNAGVIGGTWGTTRVYVLTRDRPDGVLWVIDAERYLCSADHYTCDEAYGFSRDPCKPS